MRMHIMAMASRSHVVAISSIECEPQEINPLAKTKHAGAVRRSAMQRAATLARDEIATGVARDRVGRDII